MSGSRAVLRVPRLKYHLLRHPDHAQGEAADGAGLREHSGVCPAGEGKDKRSSSNTERPQQRSKRFRLRRTVFTADEPTRKAGTKALQVSWPPGSW